MRTAKIHPEGNDAAMFDQKIEDMRTNARSGIIRDGRTRIYTRRMADIGNSSSTSPSNNTQDQINQINLEINHTITDEKGTCTQPDSSEYSTVVTNENREMKIDGSNKDKTDTTNTSNIIDNHNSTQVILLINKDDNEDCHTTKLGTLSDSNTTNNIITDDNRGNIKGTGQIDRGTDILIQNSEQRDGGLSGQDECTKTVYTREDWNRYTCHVFFLLFIQTVIASVASMVFYYWDEPQKFIKNNQWTLYVIYALLVSSIIFSLTTFRSGQIILPPFLQLIAFSALLGVSLGFLTGAVNSLFPAKVVISVAVGCLSVFLLTLITKFDFKSVLTYIVGFVGVGLSIVIHIFMDDSELMQKLFPTLAALAYIFYLLAGLWFMSSYIGVEPTSYCASSIAVHFSIVFVVLKMIGV